MVFPPANFLKLAELVVNELKKYLYLYLDRYKKIFISTMSGELSNCTKILITTLFF